MRVDPVHDHLSIRLHNQRTKKSAVQQLFVLGHKSGIIFSSFDLAALLHHSLLHVEFMDTISSVPQCDGVVVRACVSMTGELVK